MVCGRVRFSLCGCLVRRRRLLSLSFSLSLRRWGNPNPSWFGFPLVFLHRGHDLHPRPVHLLAQLPQGHLQLLFFLLRRRRHDVRVGSVFLVLLRCFDREKDQANRRTRHNVFSGANFFSLVQAHRCRFFSLLFYSFVTLSPRSLVLWFFVSDLRGPF